MASSIGLARLLVSFFAALCLAQAALAGALAPGNTVVGPPGTTAIAEPQLNGKVVEDVSVPFSYAGWFEDAFSGRPRVEGNVTGSVRSRVVLAADGTYDFYWQVSVDRSAFLPIAGFTVSGLAPATYNTDWRSDLQGSVVPAFIAEETTGEVAWHFGQYIPPSAEIYPGDTSTFFFLDSSAHHYARSGFFSLLSERDSGGSLGINWGGESGLVPTFAPASEPVPATSKHAPPPALANAFIDRDAELRTLAGRKRGCIVSKIAEQQARFDAYGPKHGPYDEAAIEAAARSFADLCR